MACSFLAEAGLLDLPESVGKLASLEKLWLTQNALRDLPASLEQLTRLRALLAGGNVFKEVPQVGRHGGREARQRCVVLYARAAMAARQTCCYAGGKHSHAQHRCWSCRPGRCCAAWCLWSSCFAT